MAHVRLRIEGEEDRDVKVDRVPVAGDFILEGSTVWKVIVPAFTPGAMIEGMVFVEKAEERAAEALSNPRR